MNEICKLIYIDHLKQKHIVHHRLHYRTRNGTSHMKGRFSVPASSNERLQMGGLSGNQLKKQTQGIPVPPVFLTPSYYLGRSMKYIWGLFLAIIVFFSTQEITSF